jgi:two-component system cell cycle sensor histidine kinase/response regulator CckA
MARVPKTILVVEDEVAVATVVRVALEREGHVVLCAEDAEEAIAVAGAHAEGIDLLITDLLLPGGNARALVGDLERMGLTPPVLYISGYTQPASGLPGPRALFLAKPFALTELAWAVTMLLAD